MHTHNFLSAFTDDTFQFLGTHFGLSRPMQKVSGYISSVSSGVSLGLLQYYSGTFPNMWSGRPYPNFIFKKENEIGRVQIP